MNNEPQQIPSHVPPHLVGEHPLRPGFLTPENPFETLIPKLHAGPPVFFDPRGYLGIGPAWIFRRAADLQAIYQDTEHFSSKDFAPFSKLLGDTWSVLPAEIDPPMHNVYRTLLNPLFTPKRMAQMDGRVREIARGYIAKFKDRGRCEFQSEFAFRFPIAVFLELMDLPLERVEDFLAWEHGMFYEADMAKVAATTRKVKDYLNGVIEARSKDPREDLISFGLKAQIQGRPLTHDELFGFCFNLFVGGLDTVSTNLTLQFRHLAERPDHQQWLREHPEKIPAAIEELLRAYSAVSTARTCVKPVQVAGVQIMPGDKVVMATSVAGRDPDAFENANEVKLDRNPRHIAFGYGIHRCLGAPLARRELAIAYEEFFSAVPEFRLEPGVQITTHAGFMIQPVALPLVWKV